MATYTPNIDLKKPAQSDKIRIADLNGNADNIDAALGADFGVSNKPSVDDAVNSLGAGLAIISNGDIHAAITAGQYVYVRGHGTLTEGLYVATANVSQNGALTGNNVDAVSGGGLNALNSKMLKKTSKSVTFDSTGNGALFNATDSVGKLVVQVIITGDSYAGYPAPIVFRAWNNGIWYCRAFKYSSGTTDVVISGTYSMDVYYFDI